ncbi:MAG: DegV family protein [Clostridiales bacterium]|nr:DegV family protein [Clostridiales bacterium]
MALRIITDSASDLPKELAKNHQIEVLPLIVYLNEVEYLDSVTIEPNDMYEAMIKGASVKTAQIPLNHFLDYFEKFAKTGDEYIYLAFSSGLSGTYQTSVLAYETVKEEFPEFKMTIIDTKCVSLGLGVIVVEAAKLVQTGASYDEVMSYVNRATGQMKHVFSVDDLDYLLRGGRVSKSQAMIGNILNIKPILQVVDGFLVPFDKAKGKKKLLAKLYEYIEANGSGLDNQLVGIAHTLNEEEATEVKNHFETVYGTRNFIINTLGCAVGAHCGPGMITIFFKNEF